MNFSRNLHESSGHKKRKLIIATFLVFSIVLYPMATRANDPIMISQGESAPFAGILLSKEDAARTQVKIEFLKEELELIHSKELELLEARHLKVLSELRIQKEGEIAALEIRLAGEKERNKILSDFAKESNSGDNIWYFIGGTAAGIILSIGIMAAVLGVDNGI